MAVNHLVPGSNPGAGAIFFAQILFEAIKWIGKAGFAEWKHSAFFVQQKNEPNPEGGLTPQGSLSISEKRKAEGNTKCRSHFFALKRQKNMKPAKASLRTEPAVLHTLQQAAMCFMRHKPHFIYLPAFTDEATAL